MKDIRSPFYNVFAEKKTNMKEIIAKKQLRYGTSNNQQVRQASNTRITYTASSSTTENSTENFSYTNQKSNYQHEDSKNKRKTKKNGNIPTIFTNTTPQQEPQVASFFSREIKGFNYHQINIPTNAEINCVGTINTLRLKNLPDKFETTLAAHPQIGDNSGVKHLRNKNYELRPRGDDRVIGQMYQGFSGPASIHNLADAMEVYEELAGSGQKLSTIIFDKYASNHNAISRKI